MSLVLRKKCQEILDAYGMSKFHVGIEADRYSTKHLIIQTECGKEVCRLHGIVFSKLSPTMGEIEYAVELLDAFMGQHQATVNAFIKQTEIVANNIAPEKPVATYIKSWEKYNKSYLQFDVDGFQITGSYSTDQPTIVTWHWEYDTSQDPNIPKEGADLKKPVFPKFPKKEVEALFKHHLLVVKENTERSKLNEIATQLAKCDI